MKVRDCPPLIVSDFLVGAAPQAPAQPANEVPGQLAFVPSQLKVWDGQPAGNSIFIEMVTELLCEQSNPGVVAPENVVFGVQALGVGVGVGVVVTLGVTVGVGVGVGVESLQTPLTH